MGWLLLIEKHNLTSLTIKQQLTWYPIYKNQFNVYNIKVQQNLRFQINSIRKYNSRGFNCKLHGNHD